MAELLLAGDEGREGGVGVGMGRELFLGDRDRGGDGFIELGGINGGGGGGAEFG